MSRLTESTKYTQDVANYRSKYDYRIVKFLCGMTYRGRVSFFDLENRCGSAHTYREEFD